LRKYTSFFLHFSTSHDFSWHFVPSDFAIKCSINFFIKNWTGNVLVKRAARSSSRKRSGFENTERVIIYGTPDNWGKDIPSGTQHVARCVLWSNYTYYEPLRTHFFSLKKQLQRYFSKQTQHMKMTRSKLWMSILLLLFSYYQQFLRIRQPYSFKLAY